MSGEADPYLYPGTDVLKNKLGITDPAALEAAETENVLQRISEGVPLGRFDFDHLKAIHRHLFQDLYTWAGEPRTHDLYKGESRFMPPERIDYGFLNIYQRIVDRNFLRGMDVKTFAQEAGRIFGDINYLHPFREGNGRAQLHYFEQLSTQAGHPLDLTKMDKAMWLEASIVSHEGNYRALAAEIERIAKPISRAPEREIGIDF